MCCRHFARNVTSSFFRASAQHIIKVSFHYYISYGYMLCSYNCNIVTVVKTGLLIFRGKKSKISRDFQGQIRRKIGRFRGILAEKVKFRRIFGANSQKNQPISREISGGNFAKKQSVKNSRFRWIFLANFAKIDQFCVDMTSVV